MGCCQVSKPVDPNYQPLPLPSVDARYNSDQAAARSEPRAPSAASAASAASASRAEEKKEEGFITGLIHKAEDAIHKAEDAVGGALHSAQEAVASAVHAVTDPYEVFEAKLEIAVVKTLNWVSPKASEKVKNHMATAVPGLDKVDMVMDKTEETVHGHIMDQKSTILDMCQDFLENMADGFKPIKSLKAAFKKVGVLILRVVKGAVTAGVMLLMGLAGVCACLCGALINTKQIIDKLFGKLVKMVKKHLKKILKAKAPDWMVDKLPWNWTINTDIGSGRPITQMKRQEGIQTQRQAKGKPDYEPRAEKEAAKPPRGIKDRQKTAALAAGGGLAAGALAGGAAFAVMNRGEGEEAKLLAEETDAPPDDDVSDGSDYGDDSEEENSDGYSDFDAEEGEASEDDPPAEEAGGEEQAAEEAGEAPEDAQEEPPEEVVEEAAEEAAEEAPPEEEAAEEEPPQEEE